MINIYNLPKTLQEQGLFCVWRYEKRKGEEKPTKVPYNPKTSGKAQPNNPATFAPLTVASSVMSQFDGLGIGIFGDMCAIDIDHCVEDDGALSDMARHIIRVMDSYTEYSPSGKGIRILFMATGFIYDKVKYYINNKSAGLEVYVAGATMKYVTVTGNTLIEGRNLETRHEELKTVLNAYMQRPIKESQSHDSSRPGLTVSIGDVELLGKIFKSKNGGKFKALWHGDTSGFQSASEADLSVCNTLAFYTGCDAVRMDAMFRTSALMRDKWDRVQSGSTYGAITIQKSIQDCREVYTPGGKSTKASEVFIPEATTENTAPANDIQALPEAVLEITPEDVLELIPEEAPESVNGLLTDDVLDKTFGITNIMSRERLICDLRNIARKGGYVREFDALVKLRKLQEDTPPQDPDEPREIYFKDMPLYGLQMPDNWKVTYGGISRVSEMGFVEKACSHPVIITERLSNIDTGAAKLTIAFLRDHKWTSVPVACSTVASRNSIVSLADRGLMVTSENAKHLVNYLNELEAENYKVIPLKKSIGRFGWVNKVDFFPYSKGYTFDGDEEYQKLYDAIHDAGTVDEWLATVGKARENSPIIRALLAASFCSPLLSKLGKQTFCTHLWGFSGHGKTVALYTAMSIWGQPDKLTQSFNATRVGIEKIAGAFHSIPLALDEREAAGNLDLSSVIYTLTNPQGRLRGTKVGGIQPRDDWNLTLLTNGENPLLSRDSKTGMFNRVLELYCKDELFHNAPAMADFVKSHYGAVGRLWIKKLVDEEERDNLIRLRKVYDIIFKSLNTDKVYTDKPMGSLAALLLADRLVSMWLYGSCDVDADQQMWRLCDQIKSMIPTKKELDQTERGWEHLQNWIIEHKSMFVFSGASDRWGRALNDDEIFIMTNIFNKAFEETEFEPTTMVGGFKERGYLYANKANKAVTQQRINGATPWGYRLKIKTTWASESGGNSYHEDQIS